MNAQYRNNKRVPTPEEVAAHREQMRTMVADKIRIDAQRAEMHEEYRKMGFDVDRNKVLKSEFFIDVKAKEVVIDADFYDRGDEYN